MEDNHSLVPVEAIAGCILVVRGQKVILDADLARLYGVETGALNRAVKRNLDRFPPDFIFQLTGDEFQDLRCHFGISSDWGGRRYEPYAFTEHGAVMAATILKTDLAATVSVYVVRAFVKLREMMASHAELSEKLADLEERVEARLDAHDEQIGALIEAIRELMVPPESSQRRIGFRIRERRARYRTRRDQG